MERMIITKLRRNAKALSPIFAVLILIAIAVIAGIIVYMFASGTLAAMMGGGTTGQEKAAIQGATIEDDLVTVTVFAQYVDGGNPIVINGALIKDANGTQIAAETTSAFGTLPVDGALTEVELTVATALDITHSYTVTLTSSKGGSFVSSSFP